jgi:hypothetical protein
MTNEHEILSNAVVVMTVKLGLAAAGNNDGELMLDAAELLGALTDRLQTLDEELNQANIMVQRLLVAP